VRITLLLHIIGGSVGLISGYIAIFAAKGSPLHRRSGLVFVSAMLLMSLSGSFIAAQNGVKLSVIAGLVTAYLVTTALTTVLPRSPLIQRLDRGAMLMGLTVGATSLMFGLEIAINGGSGGRLFPFVFMGLPALFGGIADLRMLRAGGLTGSYRLARHLWRMSYALLIAAMSFFLGQADLFPEALQSWPLLSFPVVVVLVLMLYWIWRVRFRGNLRGLAISLSLRGAVPREHRYGEYSPSREEVS
jgi:uncharacterized membrane protein